MKKIYFWGYNDQVSAKTVSCKMQNKNSAICVLLPLPSHLCTFCDAINFR